MNQDLILRDLVNRVARLEKYISLIQQDSLLEGNNEAAVEEIIPAVEVERITEDQLSDLHHELEEHPVMTKAILRGLKIESLKDMPRDQYRSKITIIRNQKLLLLGSPKKEW